MLFEQTHVRSLYLYVINQEIFVQRTICKINKCQIPEGPYPDFATFGVGMVEKLWMGGQCRSIQEKLWANI